MQNISIYTANLVFEVEELILRLFKQRFGLLPAQI